MTRDYVIPLLKVSPEKEMSNSDGPTFILIVNLVTFPQPAYRAIAISGQAEP